MVEANSAQHWHRLEPGEKPCFHLREVLEQLPRGYRRAGVLYSHTKSTRSRFVYHHKEYRLTRFHVGVTIKNEGVYGSYLGGWSSELRLQYQISIDECCSQHRSHGMSSSTKSSMRCINFKRDKWHNFSVNLHNRCSPPSGIFRVPFYLLQQVDLNTRFF
jgi:hypothetical protein